MIGVLLAILPFALAAAISPMMLTEQTLLLTSSGGRPASRRYAIAAALALLIFVALLVFFGRAISLPQEPKLSARLDIALGAALVFVAYPLLRRSAKRPRTNHGKSSATRFETKGAYAFGAFSMATNFTSLALVVPASKIIAASETSFPERETIILVLVAIVATPAWLPLALTGLAPGPATRFLDAVQRLIQSRGRQLVRALVLALGLILLGHGIIHFL